MKTWVRMALLTLVIGFVAFAAGPRIWPPTPEIRPTPGQMPFILLLSALEALTLGLGISFLILGRPGLRAIAPQSRRLATLAYFAIAWSLMSWWPHDNIHIHNGMYLQGLLYIDYGFHLTLIASALTIAVFFLHMVRLDRAPRAQG